MEDRNRLPLSMSKKKSLLEMVGQNNKQFVWRKCIFVNCGRTPLDEANIQFLRIPRVKEIAEQWINNSGNLKLLRMLKLLPSNKQLLYFVCWNHFEDDDLIVVSSKCVAKKSAIPKSFTLPDVIAPEKLINHTVVGDGGQTESNMPPESIESEIVQEVLVRDPLDTSLEMEFKEDIDIIDIQTEEHNLENECINNMLIETNSESNPNPGNAQYENTDYLQSYECKRNNFEEECATNSPNENNKRTNNQQQNNHHVEKIFKLSFDCPRANNLKIIGTDIMSYMNNSKASAASKAITSMQVLPRAKEQWTEEEKELALGLFYKSPSAYKFLQEQKLILPSTDTIRSWIGDFDFKAGINLGLFLQVKRKISTMADRDKFCMLVFADIQIEDCFIYSVDGKLVEGFQDFGDSQTNKLVRGTDVLLLYLKGIYSDWQIPLAYAVMGKIKCEIKIRILLYVTIKCALDVGLTVCGVFGDIDYNSKYPLLLAELGVTEDRPYFLVEQTKIFGFINVFSIFEMIKLQWAFYNFLFCGSRVSLKDVLPALNEKMLEPGAEKSVSDLPPIFSRSMSSIIKQAVKDRKLDSEIGNNTADFIKCLSNLYEVLQQKDFEANGFMLVINKTLNKLKNNVQRITKEGPEELLVLKHLTTTLMAIISFCNDHKPEKYPNLTLRSSVLDYTRKIFSLSQSSPTLQSIKLQFRECFVNGMMKSLNEYA